VLRQSLFQFILLFLLLFSVIAMVVKSSLVHPQINQLALSLLDLVDQTRFNIIELYLFCRQEGPELIRRGDDAFPP
jgi:competence protein ComGF